MQWEFGPVKDVASRLLELPMTSNFEVEIIVNAGKSTKAVFESVHIDNEFYPANPTKTKMVLDEDITISISSDHLPHLRANLNSTLRLIQASHDSIESVTM